MSFSEHNEYILCSVYHVSHLELRPGNECYIVSVKCRQNWTRNLSRKDEKAEVRRFHNSVIIINNMGMTKLCTVCTTLEN